MRTSAEGPARDVSAIEHPRARALNDRVVCYLRKPIDERDLIRCLHAALHSGGSPEEDSAGTGVGILPEFILRNALAAGQLERLLPDWSLPSGAVYWVTPPGGPRPKRVEVLGDFLVEKLSRHAKRGARVVPTGMLRPASKAKRR